MGQKVNPNGFRLGGNKSWQSKWYASKKDYSTYLLRDIKIREYLVKTLSEASVSDILIERTEKSTEVTIFTAKPGVIIGRGGEEIEKIKLSEEIIKEPVDRIVQIQKNITSRPGSTIANTSNGNTKIFKVTAYCSCAKCCGKKTGRTASGTQASAGHTVAASGQFAFGTKLIINGKEYTVEDRGGAIQGNRIDIYMNSHAEALAWGVRYLPVTVVE